MRRHRSDRRHHEHAGDRSGDTADLRVADTWDGSAPSSIRHALLGFDIDTGASRPGCPASVDPPGSTPRLPAAAPGTRAGRRPGRHRISAAITATAGRARGYHGWIVAVLESARRSKASAPREARRGGGLGCGERAAGGRRGQHVGDDRQRRPRAPFGYQESVSGCGVDMGAALVTVGAGGLAVARRW